MSNAVEKTRAFLFGGHMAHEPVSVAEACAIIERARENRDTQTLRLAGTILGLNQELERQKQHYEGGVYERS